MGMAEAGKENVFLREKCEKCFVEIIDAMISTSNNNTGIQKLISAFFQTLKSKNQTQRTLTAQYFESIITKLGLGRALCDIKVITITARNAPLSVVRGSLTEPNQIHVLRT